MAVYAVAVLMAASLACARPAAPPSDSALVPLATTGARLPDDPDLAARDVALAALAEPRALAASHLARLAADEAERAARGEPPTGLLPTAQDLVNATLDDPIAYRRAAQALLARDDLSPALRERLDEAVEDDPLRLASQRMRDARMARTARVFNAIVAPASRIATAGVRGAWGVLNSLMNLAVTSHLEDELALQERQALVHWKRFLEKHPDAPEAPAIAQRTEETQRRWARTRRDRALRSARNALEHERWDAALVLADRAAHYAPEDPEAREIAEQAAGELERIHAGQARSLLADAETAQLDADPAALDLALALLAPEGDVEAAARSIIDTESSSPLADEARFALAQALPEDEDLDELEEVAGFDPARSNMARHAAATVGSPLENPWDAFRAARSRDRGLQAGWIFLGPLAVGARDRDLPRPLEYAIELPTFVEMLITFPNRLIRFPFLSPWPFGHEAAVYARRYLAAEPEGLHAEDAADWLEGWEAKRGNWIAALEIASRDGSDARCCVGLRERAAEQGLEAASKQTRLDTRLDMLRHVAREFEGTDAASQASADAREEIAQASAQGIRISRGFLEENPAVAGPEGLGLRPELLDGKPANGELHSEGVVLVGGRTLEFRFIDQSGSQRSEPEVRRQKVSAERLARLVALLDETSTRNYREDPDDVLAPDAHRDLFFERARLGVADTLDRRPTARSSYAFLGMRERYGIVRGRESILPFEIVVQGTLPDVGLGVFPRLRQPRATPDAILYR